jgi:hypothetical protein
MGANLCAVTFPLIDTSAPHDDLSTVSWASGAGTRCPDNSTGASCNAGTKMTPFSPASSCSP